MNERLRASSESTLLLKMLELLIWGAAVLLLILSHRLAYICGRDEERQKAIDENGAHWKIWPKTGQKYIVYKPL